MTSNKRKPFQNLPGNENPQFLEDGLRIYKEIRHKYSNNTDEDLDNILNGLCVSIIILIKNNVSKENHKQFLQLVWNILNQNL